MLEACPSWVDTVLLSGNLSKREPHYLDYTCLEWNFQNNRGARGGKVQAATQEAQILAFLTEISRFLKK